MIFKDWTPPVATKVAEHWRTSSVHSVHPEYAESMSLIWLRLATDDRMKDIWPTIIGSADEFQEGDPLFFAWIDTAMRDFYILPKLNEPKYIAEMKRIAALAKKLSMMMEKFDNKLPLGNPFGWRLLYANEIRENIAEVLDDVVEDENNVAYVLESLPTAYEHVCLIAERALKEAEVPSSRTALSRQAEGKSSLKVYFVSRVITYFILYLSKFEPQTIAIVCQVGLGDPEPLIDAETVRKLMVDPNKKKLKKKIS